MDIKFCLAAHFSNGSDFSELLSKPHQLQEEETSIQKTLSNLYSNLKPRSLEIQFVKKYLPIPSKFSTNKQQGKLILIFHVDEDFFVSHLNAVQEETRQHHISLSGVWAKLELEDDSNLLLVFLYLKKIEMPKNQGRAR